MNNRIIEEDLSSIYNANIDWKLFTNKTVLITGASGFLPAYMVETLLYVNKVSPGINIKVIALVRNKEKAEQKFKEHLSNRHLEILVQDVCTPVTISAKIDYIVHAASQASPKYYGIDPVGTLSPNVLGTINMLQLAKEKKVVSFLYFSSAEVYGQVAENCNPVKESYYGLLDPMQLRACYGESKRMGENICVSYYHQFGVPVKVARPFHTYGPGMQLDDGRVYADFLRNVINNENIEVTSDGSAKRAFCYLSDATIGFLTVLLSGNVGEAYNVGNPFAEHSISELADILAQIRKNPLSVIRKAVNIKGYIQSSLARNTPDISKMIALGWIPQIGVFEGFKRTYQSYI
ncbi:NAD-dependent epimerase/dehydratase family protein [Pedobacter sp. HMF7647]|uniref:NAD-dependent epimerase/dehydratase family protein n=1 Tax=Hufsiella arboris TaxID=2695275 RepID=A0A7K1YBG5_9SPHI|nr:NAD-dependent epimerase/dehydratase family protein [Hufsiella arboris]MXV51701.1 NAD-dependent epimerase/dehydratase family protein [Hufsiella arboris]